MEKLKNLYTKISDNKDTLKCRNHNNQKNEKLVTVRFSKTEYEKLEGKAVAAGISKSEFIRKAVMGAEIKELSLIQKLIPVIAECDNEINRLHQSSSDNAGLQEEAQSCRNMINHIKNRIMKALE